MKQEHRCISEETPEIEQQTPEDLKTIHNQHPEKKDTISTEESSDKQAIDMIKKEIDSLLEKIEMLKLSKNSFLTEIEQSKTEKQTTTQKKQNNPTKPTKGKESKTATPPKSNKPASESKHGSSEQKDKKSPTAPETPIISLISTLSELTAYSSESKETTPETATQSTTPQKQQVHHQPTKPTNSYKPALEKHEKYKKEPYPKRPQPKEKRKHQNQMSTRHVSTENTNTKKKHSQLTADVCPGVAPVSWCDYNLKKALLFGIQKKGYLWPSPIQSDTIKHSLKYKNIIARSKNGTGKTAAFLIPLLNKINPESLQTQAIIVAPTRELVLQIAKVCIQLGEFLKVKVVPLIGGNSTKDDIIRLQSGATIVIGTPGRLLDFIDQSVLKMKYCRHLIMDEADKLLSKGFKEIVCSITEVLPPRHEIELYSATFPYTVQEYIDQYMPNTIRINQMKELSLIGIDQYYAYVRPANKLHCLKTLLNILDLDKCFIFCNNVNIVTKVAKRMTELGFSAYYIHSKMKQEERNIVFHNFSTKKECKILVCTDLVTRGIDVPNVNVVINFDLPNSTESYLHRIGRTGRFGTKGIAVNMIIPEHISKIQMIETELGIELLPFSEM
ncbi:ATP-dependent RNA helicase DDX6/DHH1 [Nematocida sp. AWRm80]|nr:ATP-dependent RNA helicase DDX6/DHH1 [Nematocida sp. AWRm80]